MAGDIIIKKVKKGGHGHHGGAWKVAYADFVTAMMAFFLLLWLLNSIEAEKLAGLADYFAPTVGLSKEMGVGFRGGSAALSSGVGVDKNTNKGIIFAGMPSGAILQATEKIEQDKDQKPENEKINIEITSKQEELSDEIKKENKGLEEAENMIKKAIQNSLIEEGIAGDIKDFIDTKITPDGLEVELQNKSEKIFIKDTSTFTPLGERILQEVAVIVKSLPNYVSLEGHTNALPTSVKDYEDNFTLSTERAINAKKIFNENGIYSKQLLAIMGRANNQLKDFKRPYSTENERIGIIIVRPSALPRYKKVVQGDLF